MNDTIILQDISYDFGHKKVLEGLNLSIPKGSFHSLIGISGAGKSLTLKLIASLLPLQKGAIYNRPSKINYAFQFSPLIPWLNIRENLEICTSDFNELNDYLKKFKLETIAQSFPDELSGGMIQKINILRSFLGRPDLILMDEPLVHIDSIQKEELQHFLKSLWKSFRPTIIFVTHDIDEALFLSQTISLYSLQTKSIAESINLPDIESIDYLELKNSANYSTAFKKIYCHLKQDQN